MQRIFMRAAGPRRALVVALGAALLAGLLPGALGRAAVALGAEPAAACALPGGDAGTIDFGLYQRPIGAIRALMIFVDFPDAPAAATTTPSKDVFLPGAPDWFSTTSYGQLQLSVATVPQWFRMPRPSTTYEFDRGLSFDAHRAYIADAVAAADSAVNFAGYQLYYVVANPEATAISFSPAFIAGPAFDVEADGAAIGHVATFGEDMWTWGYKVLNHETGHLFGLPDLYEYEGDDIFRFTGGWDLMGDILGHAPDYLAWFKWQLGWLTASQVTCLNSAATTEVDLTPLSLTGGRKLVVLRTGASTAIAAEYRTQSGNDATACNAGLLVYTINNRLKSGEGLVRVLDARPGGASRVCETDLDDGAWDPSGPAFSDAATGITIQVLSTSTESARIRVTRSKAFTLPDVRHARTITLTTSSRSGGFVTATGVLSVPDGYTNCRNAKVLSLQEKRSGVWVTIRTSATNSSGRWTFRWKARAGTYRLIAAQVIVGSNPRHVCLSALSSTRAVR